MLLSARNCFLNHLEMAKENSGHAKTVSNFKQVVMTVKNMNGHWNPVNDKLKIENMEARHAACEIFLNRVDAAEALDKIKTEARFAAYKSLNEVVRRVVAAMKSCEMDAKMIESATTIKKLIDGTNVSDAAQKRAKAAEQRKILLGTEGVESTDDIKAYSVSKQDYDSRLKNFKRLMTLLEQAGNYATNQSDLTLTALNDFATALSDANNATNNAYDQLDNIRKERNDLLYGESDSIVNVVTLTKNELDAMETKQGPNHKKVASFKFNKPRE